MWEALLQLENLEFVYRLGSEEKNDIKLLQVDRFLTLYNLKRVFKIKTSCMAVVNVNSFKLELYNIFSCNYFSQ